MVSRSYPNLLTLSFGAGTLDWANDTIRAMLVNASATYDRTHQFVSSVVANELSDGTRLTLASKTFTDNGSNAFFFDAADLTFASQTNAQTANACIIYKFVTNDADSPLLFYQDGSNITTSGNDVIVQFASGGFRSISY